MSLLQCSSEYAMCTRFNAETPQIDYHHFSPAARATGTFRGCNFFEEESGARSQEELKRTAVRRRSIGIVVQAVFRTILRAFVASMRRLSLVKQPGGKSFALSVNSVVKPL
jgi:hypothetical protein